MDDKYAKAREIVEVFDDFLNDKLANRGLNLIAVCPLLRKMRKRKIRACSILVA